MALAPIQQYDNQANSLIQILQGGQNTLSSILDRQIQVGRDIANNRIAQERDMMQMRQNETALAERRGERLQSTLIDAMKTSRRAYETDRAFAANRADAAFAQERSTANDLFTRGMQRERLDLARNADDRAEETLGLKKTDLQLRREEAARRQAEIDAAVAGSTPTPASELFTPQPASEFVGPPAPVDYAAIADRRKASGYNQDPAVIARDTNGTDEIITPQDQVQQTPSADADSLRLMEIKNLRKQKLSLPQQKRLDAEELEIKKRLPDKDKSVTERRFDISQENARKTESRKSAELLISDTDAFIPQTTVAARDAANAAVRALGDKATEEDKREAREGAKVTTENAAAAKAYDAKRFESEVNSALNRPNKEEYVNLVPGLSESQKEKRRKLWDYAHGQSSGTPTSSSAVSRIPGL